MDPSDQWGNNNPWGQPSPSPDQGPSSPWGSNTPPPGPQDPPPGGSAGPGGPGEPEEPQSSPKKPIIIAVVAILALALVGGGGWYLTKRGSSEETAVAKESAPEKPTASSSPEAKPKKSEQQTTTQETAAPSKGSCEQAKAGADMARPVSSYCDGQWALIGNYGSDHTELYYWTGDSWGTYEPDGHHSSGAMSPCYERSKLVDAQAPEKLVDEMYQGHQLCNDTPASSGSDSSGSQQNNAEDSDLPPGGDWLPYLPCRGNYALIVDSVMVYPGQNPRPLVRKSLAAHPGTVSTYPGVCAAFRSPVDGADVYPIYIDYGTDLAGVCAAENRGEGNARKLQQVADYSSPC